MSNGRKLFKLATTFLAGSAASKLLIFALLPIYTRVLDPADYGYFDVSVTVMTIVTSMVYMDVWVGTMRVMYLREPGPDRKRTARAGLILFLVATAVIVLAAVLTGIIQPIPFLALIVGYGVTTQLREFYGYVARGAGYNKSFSASGLANTFVVVGLNVVLLLGLHAGVESLYIAAIAGNLVQSIWLELRSHLIFSRWESVRSPDWRQILKFSAPLGFNSAAFWLLTGLGRIVVQNELSLTENGYFAVGAKFGAIIVVLSGVLIMAWQDLLFNRESSDSHELFQRSARYFMLFSALGFAFALPVIYLVFPIVVGGNFSEALEMIPGFALTASLAAFNSMLGNVFYSRHQTRTVLWTTLLACAIALALTWPAVELFGVNGANAALALAFLACISLRVHLLHRSVGMSLTSKDLTFAIVQVLAAGAAFYTLNVWAVSIVAILGAVAAMIYLRRELLTIFN